MLSLLSSFSISYNHSPPTNMGGNILDPVFSCPTSISDLNVTPFHLSDHHFVSFSLHSPVLSASTPSYILSTYPNIQSLSSSMLIFNILTLLPNPDVLATLPSTIPPIHLFLFSQHPWISSAWRNFPINALITRQFDVAAVKTSFFIKSN